MNEKVSIIVPVYNVESYLTECVNSLLNQIYSNIEIILVDDGSVDNSGRICDQFAEKFDNVFSIHQENSGVSTARNKGLTYASGEYIHFVDADDCLDQNTYSSIIPLMELNGLEIAFFEFEWIHDDVASIKVDEIQAKQINVLSGYEKVKIPLLYSGSACNCIFKRCSVKNKFNSKYKLAEDTLFLVENLVKTDRIIFINVPFYKRRMRVGSASRSEYDQRWITIIAAAEDIVSTLRQADKKYEEIGLFILCGKVYELIAKLSMSYKKYPQDIKYVKAVLLRKYKSILCNRYIKFFNKVVFSAFVISPSMVFTIKKLIKKR